MKSSFYHFSFLFLALFLCTARARSQDVTYSVDCWLNGNQLREQMGPTRFLRDMPDVFIVVDIEGKGRFLPAFIERGYKGQEMLISFQAPKPSLGSKILVNIYQDKSASNAFWSQLFPTEVGGGVGGKVSFEGVAVSLTADLHVNFAHKDLQGTAD